VRRLELKQIHVCQRCGRGRADLAAGASVVLRVSLDPLRARELAGEEEPGVPWLSAFLLAQLRRDGRQPHEVVLDVGPGGLRGLLSFSRAGEPEVLACTAQEGLGVAVRGALPLYATDEALAHEASQRDPEPSGTVH
jgi:hypothetical protein